MSAASAIAVKCDASRRRDANIGSYAQATGRLKMAEAASSSHRLIGVKYVALRRGAGIYEAVEAWQSLRGDAGPRRAAWRNKAVRRASDSAAGGSRSGRNSRLAQARLNMLVNSNQLRISQQRRSPPSPPGALPDAIMNREPCHG